MTRYRALASRLILCLAMRFMPGEAAEEAKLPYLVVLDFTSDFDAGALGKQVGRMFRAKSLRYRLFSVDTEIDWEERRGLLSPPASDVDLQALAKEARAKFGCDLLIWGRILQSFPASSDGAIVKTEAATFFTPDAQSRRLVLTVRGLDLRQEPAAVAIDEIYECASNYELTAKVDEAIEILSSHPTAAERVAAAPAKRMAAIGANLCAHGDFEIGIQNWHAQQELSRLLPGWIFPQPQGMALTAEAAEPGKTQGGNTVLRYELSAAVAATTGLFCYTPYIPIKSETYYQCSFRLKSEGPSVIMFVKGYRDLPLAAPRYDESGREVRSMRQEVFKHQRRFYGPKGEWALLITEPFLPRSIRPEHTPQFLRVQLYAYYPPGTVWFDEVCVRECAPVP